MSDYERYGDYNETEDDIPKKKKGPFLITMKILTTLICVLVIGTLFINMIYFSTSPKSMKRLYFNDTLTEYYNGRGGDIGAKTQELKAPYSSSKFAYFFCDNLVVIEGIGQLQITARYKPSNIKYINEEFEVELDPSAEDIFTYRLCANTSYDYDKDGKIIDNVPPKFSYSVSASLKDSNSKYRYERLVFDGVDFSDESIKWLRLEMLLPDGRICATVGVYQNDEGYSKFEEYKLSKDERP